MLPRLGKVFTILFLPVLFSLSFDRKVVSSGQDRGSLKKHSATRRLFNARLGVLKFNETRSFVSDHSYGLRYYWKYFESKIAFTIRWRKLKTQFIVSTYRPQ